MNRLVRIVKTVLFLALPILLPGCSDFDSYEEAYAEYEKYQKKDEGGAKYDCDELANQSYSISKSILSSKHYLGPVSYSYDAKYRFKNCPLLEKKIAKFCDEALYQHKKAIKYRKPLNSPSGMSIFFCREQLASLSREANTEVIFPSSESVFVEVKGESQLISLYDITDFYTYYSDDMMLWVLSVETSKRSYNLMYGNREKYELVRKTFINLVSSVIKAKHEAVKTAAETTEGV